MTDLRGTGGGWGFPLYGQARMREQELLALEAVMMTEPNHAIRDAAKRRYIELTSEEKAVFWYAAKEDQ